MDNTSRSSRRDFLRNGTALASGAVLVLNGDGIGVASAAERQSPSPVGTSQTRIEPIVQHFTGDFDSYVPLLLGNGDFGGTFDPFCGTAFDEFRSGKQPKEDIRTMLLARLMAQDYWEEQRLDPQAIPLNAATAAQMMAAAKEGNGYKCGVVRGSPFTLFLGPAEAAFPMGVQDHTQKLDLERGILTSEYSFKGTRVEVECFVHPQSSLLAYRIRSGRPMEFRIQANAGNRREGDFLIAESMSNVYCPAIAGAYAEGGTIVAGDGRIMLPAGESVLYLAYGHQSLGDRKSQMAAALDEARRKGYANIRNEHTRWWADFWQRSAVSIPDARMQQLYHRSLYYLGCSIPRKTKTPAFEAGIAGSFPAFLTGFHIQDSVYHILPMINSNHLELVEPMLEWLLEVLPIAKEIARSMFWLKGARYFWHGGPGMLPFLPGHPHFGPPTYEHHVNGWVVLAIERYLDACGWNRDKARRYYPIVSEIAKFFSSMLEPRGANGLQIGYLPSQSQAEGTDTLNHPNTFDVLVAAKWSLMVAAKMSRLLGVDEAEGQRWKREADAIDLAMLRRKDGVYVLFEGDTGATAKECMQFIGVIFPVGLNAGSLLTTYKHLQTHVRHGACAWDPAYGAIGLARLRQTDLAMAHLNRLFTDGHVERPYIMIRESSPTYFGTKKGRMPYYMAAHALYAQAIHEMLVQNWRGTVEPFPACPFNEASFRLRVGDGIVSARKTGSQYRVEKI
jgi:hypothetical protein